jgi:hypothetical protein
MLQLLQRLSVRVAGVEANSEAYLRTGEHRGRLRLGCVCMYVCMYACMHLRMHEAHAHVTLDNDTICTFSGAYALYKACILPDVLTKFNLLTKNRALYVDELEKFWSINMICARCEGNAGRIFLPRFLKSSQHFREEECMRLTDRQTDRQTERQTDIRFSYHGFLKVVSTSGRNACD